ncbi:hypothetical protein BDU57DRAFT_528204 [Ampelomyces quisqualis]|uniref:Uncharacterized protein n=1 Tax=Ampelomyces quisqualis TaxID=50730 RepID=A0A6A5QS15_AMPQU|nr:hypothetical protein BDU57DRAFT_528204 [Ampelomyces quisqualis]
MSSPANEFSAPPILEHNKNSTEPLYTEINIPLPNLPSSPQSPPAQQCESLLPPQLHSSRSRPLSSSLFSRPRSSSSSSNAEGHYIRPSLLKSREIAAAMDLSHQNKRNRRGTIDALAVVPAVLILSAELFTPGASGGKMVGGMR